MKTLKVLAVGGLLSFALIQVGFAGDGEHCGRHDRHAMHHRHGPMMHKPDPMRMLSKLDLSEPQHQQIKQILDAEKTNMQAKHETRMALMKEMHAVTSQQTFNAQKAEAVASKMGALAKEAALKKAKVGNQIYAILTPAQQAKFNQLIEERMQKRSTWRKSAHRLGVNQAEPVDGFQQI